MADNKEHSISLVLGSGGARGLAHIGVIQEFLAAGYEMRSIVGCSIGALVGGAHAAGRLSELETWVRSITKFNMVRFMDLTWEAGGIVSGEKVRAALDDILGDVAIEELPLRFTAVASDIVHEKEIWINSGSLSKAIRASISLPMILTPVISQGAVLVDGGVLNPVPIAPTFGDGSDFTVAVNLGGLPEYKQEPDSANKAEETNSFTAGLNSLVASLGLTTPEKQKTGYGMYQVFDRSFDSMQNSIARQKLAAYPPDFVIEIPRNACDMLDFYRAAEMIELGRKKAVECIEQINSRHSAGAGPV